MPNPTPAESVLGPITPIRCTEPGCHWACHGVPDKYTASRAQILADHITSEHTQHPVAEPDPATTLPAAALDRVVDLHQSYDGACGTCADADGQAAEWPCETSAALAVARQLLGTTTTEGVTPSADRRDRYAAAMALRDGHPEWPVRYEDDERDYRRRADAVMAVADAEQSSLRAEAEGLDEALRGAISASEKDGTRLRAELAAAPPAPADRAAGATYPYPDGDTTVLGPELFALTDRSALAWEGEWYRKCTPADSYLRAECDAIEADYHGQHDDVAVGARAAVMRIRARAVLADGAAAGVQQTTEGGAVPATAIPEWEAVYEPGNVSDYLIGYANSEAAAKGAAITWVLSQTDKDADRLEWTATPHGDDYDEYFELSERHGDGIDTAVGVTVRHRLRPYTAADFAPEADEQPAAPAVPEEPTSRPPRILVDLCEQHRPVIEPDPTTDGQLFVSCKACDGDRKQVISHGDPVPECRFWAMGKAYGYVSEERP
ncbi:hypothetical protein AB0M89_13305 [Streptomyces microflavus]|uniref:hypothetical protein n=1 Tax=Streptomyces microflavus TaxID=1919 RepID=UPI00342CF80D